MPDHSSNQSGIKIGLMAILFLGALAGIVILANSEHNSPSASLGLSRPQPLILADGLSSLSATLYVSYEKGFFESQGVHIKFIPYNSGASALQALTSGNADLATVADLPLAKAILDNSSFKIITTIATSNSSLGILASRGINSPTQLVGKRIGYLVGTNAEYYLHEFMTKYGMSGAQIQGVPLHPENYEAALINGAVAALTLWEPHLTKVATKMADEVVTFRENDIYSFPWNLTVSSRLARNPELIERIIKALVLGEDYLLNHRDEAISIVTRYIRSSQEDTAKMWERINFSVGLSQSLIVNLEREMQMELNSQPAKDRVPIVTDYIDGTALKKLYPGRYGVIE